jgi:hypothetical protein
MMVVSGTLPIPFATFAVMIGCWSVASVSRVCVRRAHPSGGKSKKPSL